MESYYINKHDWTQLVRYEDGKGYFDGTEYHPKITQCHEAYALDYGEANPFREVSQTDVAMFCRVADTISDYLADITAIDEASKDFVYDVGYRLNLGTLGCRIGAAEQTEELTDEQTEELTALVDALNRLVTFSAEDTGLGEPELTWAIKRAKTLALVATTLPRVADWHDEAAPTKPTRYFQDRVNHFDLTVSYQGKWYQAGREVDAVHVDSLHEISGRAANWIRGVGREFRVGWGEFKSFYESLLTVAKLGPKYEFTWNDGQFQDKYERLVDELEAGHEGLADFVSMAQFARAGAIRTARTIRFVSKKLGIDPDDLFRC